MKNLILLCTLSVLIVVVFGQYTEYNADFVMTRPSLSGSLSGTYYFSVTYKAIRFDYKQNGQVIYQEIQKFDASNANDYFVFRKCTGKCDIVPQTTSVLPAFYKQASDSCSGSYNAVAGPCTPCTKSGNLVNNVCIDTSSNPRRITQTDGTVFEISAVRNGGISSAVFDPAGLGWGCVLNCGSQVDISYVVDESGSISGNYIPGRQDDGEWHDIRTFSSKLVGGFTIASNKVNMGLVQFASGAKKVVPIIGDSYQYTNAINGLTKLIDGNTWTGSGMIYGAEQLLAAYRSVPKVIVIITDGVINQQPYPFYSGSVRFNTEADWINYIHGKGIIVIAVGVGDGISQSFLDKIATSDASGKKLTFLANTFTSLTSTSLINAIGKTVCTAGQTVSPCGNCNGLCQCGVCGCPDCDFTDKCKSPSCTVGVTNGCIYPTKNCDDGDACTTDTCNSATGCLHTAIPPCNDNNACTDDSCDKNLGCRYITKSASFCDDNNACTDDSCDPASGCKHTPKVCNDNNACTTDTCDTTSGCKFTAISCNDNNACTTDTCDTATGCKHTAVVCDDNNPCTNNTCDTIAGCKYLTRDCKTEKGYSNCNVTSCIQSSGLCAAPINICDDANACTTNCAPPPCQFQPIDCTNGSKCILPDCDKTTGCKKTPVNCDDGNACTTDTCDPATGCKNTVKNCVDTDICTDDSCDPTVGCKNVRKTCDDGNACTDDTCNSVSGCVNTPKNCDDGNACTVDTCDFKTGCNHTALNCNDGNACSNDTCDKLTGCSNSKVVCDNGDACYHKKCNTTTGCYFIKFNDTLKPGSPEECDDFNDCTIDTCDSKIGCVHVNKTCPNPYNDSCIVNFCDIYDGCKSEPMRCNNTDTCFVAYCDSQKGSALCISEELESCKLAKIIGGTAAAVLGVGAIIAIIIAAVLCAAGSAAGAYAGYNYMFKGEFTNKNPLFEAQTQTGSNPAFGRHSVFNQQPVNANK